MIESIQGLLDEHADLQKQLADPAVHADQGKARKLGRRYSELNGIVEAYNRVNTLRDDIEAAREMAAEDPDFADEIKELEAQLPEAEEKLRRLLIPRDPDDGRNVILEVKGGEGGDEASLFAADLLRMYTRYAESKGWKTEMISSQTTDVGGYKDAQVAIKGTSNDPAEGVWAHLKYEGGVHRVQRVPATESQGRIHTSAAGVLVFPEVDEPEEIEISQNDLKIDVYRSSGPGGQSVNTTDSAVRITHLPTGIVVQCQSERSQIQNRETCMRMLRAKLAELHERERQEQMADVKGELKKIEWGSQIRSYVFQPYTLVKDHRTGYEMGDIDAVMDGDLEGFVTAYLQKL